MISEAKKYWIDQWGEEFEEIHLVIDKDDTEMRFVLIQKEMYDFMNEFHEYMKEKENVLVCPSCGQQRIR